MWMNRLTIMNEERKNGTYVIVVSDMREYSKLNRVELIERINELLDETVATAGWKEK